MASVIGFSPIASAGAMKSLAAQQRLQATASGNAVPDGVGLSSTASATLSDPAFQAANAKTQRTDAVLAKLGQGPLDINGQTISQKDGYQGVRNDAWDRLNGAYKELPPAAQEAIQNNMTLLKSEFAKSPENVAKYNSSPDMQAEYQYTWMAQAAGSFANSPAESLKVMGSDPNMKLNQAALLNLGDGSRQYLEASQGYLGHGGAPGQ